jgi:hypothetical protein
MYVPGVSASTTTQPVTIAPGAAVAGGSRQ